MLESLDEIDWASLTHAYGPAADVPGLLRSLLSPDKKVREEAIYELFGNIWHQGTVYPATAAAVPFLYDLLSAPEVQDKSSIAHLLACIADGVGYLEAHATPQLGESTWRKILAKQDKSLEAELAREAAEINSVRGTASAGLHELLSYLSDSEPDIRQAVAVALGNYPEHAECSLPALQAALASEVNDEVLEALAKSESRLSKQ